jgi:DNA-binding NtrC family response regulator
MASRCGLRKPHKWNSEHGLEARTPGFAWRFSTAMVIAGEQVEATGGRTALRKILIVEDDALIAMELGERLAEMGYAVIGPAHTISEAEALIASDTPDAALLDANVAGQSSVGVGAVLAERGVPVAFCTGYDAVKNLPPSLEKALVLTKPLTDEDLRVGIEKLLS